jgi:hypothetical protein
LIKTNAAGMTTWIKTFSGSDQPFFYCGNSVQQAIDGGYIITGYSGTDSNGVFLLKTDENGNVK